MCSLHRAAVCPQVEASGWKFSHGCCCFLGADRRGKTLLQFGAALRSRTGNTIIHTAACAEEEAAAVEEGSLQYLCLCKLSCVNSRLLSLPGPLSVHVTICTQQLAAASVPHSPGRTWRFCLDVGFQHHTVLDRKWRRWLKVQGNAFILISVHYMMFFKTFF